MNNKTKECILLTTFFFVVIILYYLKIPIPCLFHKITHLYCPGCGVTRMISSIISFNFYQAFSYNAYVFILLVLSVVYFIIKLVIYVIWKKKVKVPNYIYYVLILFALIFAILRNISTFSYLAP